MGKMKINKVSSDKYLSNINHTYGTNIIYITIKCNRRTGSTTKIQNILDNMCFGNFYFKIGKHSIEIMLLY